MLYTECQQDPVDLAYRVWLVIVVSADFCGSAIRAFLRHPVFLL